MRHLIILFILLVGPLCAIAKKPIGEEWQRANSFYQQKEYDSAAAYYEKVAAMQPGNAIAFYNLGNTYYRLNNIGGAVLSYERALHIDPSLKEAADNLALTQSRIANRIQPIPEIFFVRWWHGITCASKAGTWAIISLLLFLSAIGILTAQRFNKLRAVPVQATVGIFGLLLVSLILAFSSAANKANSGKAVVMVNDAPLFPEPKEGKAQNLVPEGTTVEWTTERNGWLEVQLPDGRTGWIRQDAVSKV